MTLSTTEAYYVALEGAMKELLFQRQVWCFILPGKGMRCFSVFEGNQGVDLLAQNPVKNSAQNPNTFIDVRHHF